MTSKLVIEENKGIMNSSKIIGNTLDAKVNDLELDFDTKKLYAYWNKCLEFLKDNTDTQVYKTWFSPLKPLKWVDNQVTLQVPSQFFMEWIEEHYFDLLQKTMIKVFGEETKLLYQIIVDNQSDNEKAVMKVPAFRYPPAGSQSAISFKTQEKSKYQPNLNPRYSFDNFIVGESNQLATSAARAVANNPGGTSFNPLVMYSQSGLGKTHLIQAIGNELLKKNPQTKLVFVNCETFTNDFISAIQYNKPQEFSSYYRGADVLIIDDIHFLEGKDKTQDNFFFTFNALHQAGKQIILTSDRPLKELTGIEQRLISRFQWGLTVDIQKPDFETRAAILKKKSEYEGIKLPDDIIQYMAQNITESIRELEGSLIRLIAEHTFDSKPLTIELAKEVIKGFIKNDKKSIDINLIKKIVSEYFNLDLESIESKSRKHEIALARQFCMYIAKQFTQMSLKSIGAEFGGRDHSTVLHSCTTIENYLETDKYVRSDYEKIKARLTENQD